MKLIPLTILLTSLAVSKAQKYRQEHFPFPPQFQTPNAGMFSTDSSHYLPPESHTPIPYFPIKNSNGLQYPLLPPTGTKAPSVFPTPFPFVISTTLVPNFDDDDDDEGNGRIRLSTSPPFNSQRHNQSERNYEQQRNHEQQANAAREIRTMSRMNFQQPIQNRNDIKFPFKPPPAPAITTSTSTPPNLTPATRRMIIESPKSDLGLDQLKAASYYGPQFIPAGPGVYVSSTTEPAIPILRLSNEMDLDGSFSYEALGADQTHYVQHSRMENMGPDKQEQVVEGSYSYVGDNGQTYTVHYIADSNGFRASGDHLPVAPPVPEIIQRAVQYNLAEEAKKPPHLRDWQDNGKDNEISDNNRNVQFSLPPPRNLFTGRTPEAFSYSYSQGSNAGNNLVAAASNQVPIKTVDYTTEQPKPKANNNGPISPQITFLASQGAHVPMNSVQDTISRMYTADKPNMPQIVNYEAGVKEADQEPNKGLWRWQYGINANNLIQNTNKGTISRSSGEGDDIMINFSDMTPDQYTNMIRSQFEHSPDNEAINQYSQNQFSQNWQNNQQTNQNNNFAKFYQNQQPNPQTQYENQNSPNNHFLEKSEDSQPSVSTVTALPQSQEYYKETNTFNYQLNHDYQTQSTSKPLVESRKLIPDTSKLLTHKDFLHPSQTITQSYDFDENSFYEPRKIKALNNEPFLKPTAGNVNQLPNNNFHKSSDASVTIWTKNENEIKESTTPEPHISTFNNVQFSDFILQESKNDFKPIVTTIISTEAPRIETTTENIVENILQNNIFLKSLFNAEKSEIISTNKSEVQQFAEVKTDSKMGEESKKILHIKVEAEPKTDKYPKFVQYQPKSGNEVKLIKKKPVDIADILNYVSMKNHFESGKVKPKTKPVSNYDNRNEIRFIPIQQEREEREEKDVIQEQKPTFRPSPEQQEELRGMIKNYKVLHRNNNVKYDHSSLKRELSPPPLESPLPPLGRAGPSMKSYLPPIYV